MKFQLNQVELFWIRTSLFPFKTALGKYNLNGIYKSEWLVDVIPKIDLITIESIKLMVDTISGRLVKFMVGQDHYKMARLPYFRIQSLHNLCGKVGKPENKSFQTKHQHIPTKGAKANKENLGG